jgi:hypothetical protein
MNVSGNGPQPRRARGRRAARLVLALAGGVLGGCSFLENEFMTLDRRAPAARVEAMAAPASVVARP